MPKILIMDDEPLSLRRLFNALCDTCQHDLLTADSLLAGANAVERLGSSLDLLVIDVSMFGTAGDSLLDLCREACPQAETLVLTSQRKQSLGDHPQLRRPFTDQDFLQAVDWALTLKQTVAVEPRAMRRSPRPSRSDGQVLRAHASGRSGNAP